MNALVLAVACLAPSGQETAPFPRPIAPPIEAVPKSPLMDKVCSQLGICPSPVVQPFARLPRICQAQPCPCEGGGETTPDMDCWVFEFHEAAHVPYPRFGPDGCALAGDGLVIYEGMRLTVYPSTGAYDVAFTATVPHQPVTLRIQLLFSSSLQSYRLTLPPIRMEPPRDARPGDVAANTFHVAHRGFSSLFKGRPVACPECKHEKCPPIPQITCHWTIARSGTARFGSPVAIEDPTR